MTCHPQIDADPDPVYHFDAGADPDPAYHLMQILTRIRIHNTGHEDERIIAVT